MTHHPAPTTPQTLTTPHVPPGTLLLTEDLLRSFAAELTLSVANVFQQLTKVDINKEKLEATVSSYQTNGTITSNPPSISANTNTQNEGGDRNTPQRLAGEVRAASQRPTADSGNITIWQWNCQGLRSKLASLIEVARQEEIDIFLLQETLLPDIASPSLPGYNAFHLHHIPGT